MRHGTHRRDLATVIGLVVLGQVLIQVLGRLAPALVRYPGPWGPTPAPDTRVYVSAAERLPSLDPSLTTKLAYVALVRLDQSLGAQGWSLVGLQLVLLGLAAWTLLRYVGPRWGQRAGVLSAAALVLNPHVTQWTRTILTDPVFMPLLVVLVILLAVSAERPGWTPLTVGLALLIVLVRPNGLGAALGAAVILVTRLPRGRVPALLATFAMVALLVVTTPAFQSPGGDVNTLANRTYEGLVVWAEPNDVTIGMPAPDDPSDLSNAAMIRYAVQHPVAVAALGVRRVVAEITQVRGHYPRVVNVIVGVQMALFLLLAIAGAVRARRDPINRSIIAVSAGLFLVIAATWAIAEGRFGWAAFATWSPWIGIGSDALLSRIRRSP